MHSMRKTVARAPLPHVHTEHGTGTDRPVLDGVRTMHSVEALSPVEERQCRIETGTVTSIGPVKCASHGYFLTRHRHQSIRLNFRVVKDNAHAQVTS